jgi:AcrR family transcriptional regulator
LNESPDHNQGRDTVRTKTSLQSDKMLDAAARLFGTQRFHEVRMEDIAAEAEVGKGTIYRYFMDKEELYLALLTRASEQFMERLREEANREGSARLRLEGVVTAIISCFDNQPHLLDLIQRAEVMQQPGKESPWLAARHDVFRLTHDLFEAGRRQGEFTIRDPELATLILLGGLRGVIRFGAKPRAEDLSSQIVSDFLEGAGRPVEAAAGASNGKHA